MNSKALFTLLAITAVIIALAYFVAREPVATEDAEPAAAAGAQEFAFDGLADSLDTIDRIAIESSDGAFEVVQTDDGWKLEAGYWATEERVDDTLALMTSLRFSESKTSNPELFDRLGLGDPSAEESRAVRVVLFDGEDQVAEAIVGNPASAAGRAQGDGGVYFRIPGEDQSWLSRGTETATIRRGADFEDRNIVNIPPEDVAFVEATLWNDDSYRVERDENDEWIIANAPDGMELVNPREPATIAGTLQSFRYNSVMQTVEMEDELSTPSTLRAALLDGRVIEAEIKAQDDQNFWATFSASFDESVRGEDVETSVEDARADAEMLDRRFEGYLYQVPAWKTRSIRKPAEEMYVEAQPRVSASHILIGYEGAQRSEVTGRTREEAEARANEVLEMVQADPDSFATLAMEYSDGPSGPDGGDLGEFTYDAMTPPFSEAAFALDVDGISGIVETDFGFHIIKRTN